MIAVEENGDRNQGYNDEKVRKAALSLLLALLAGGLARKGDQNSGCSSAERSAWGQGLFLIA